MTTRNNDGTGLEDTVHEVYSLLLALGGPPARIEKRAKVPGARSAGTVYELDVYYEFERAGVTHRVAIECKDHGRPITQGHVNEFWGKIDDIGNVLGVMVSRRGYQSGAEAVARARGIRTLNPADLPAIGVLIGQWVEQLLLPPATTIGEPFWALFDTSQRTSTYCCLPESGPAGERLIPLFVSKQLAEAAAGVVTKRARCVARGLNQQALMALLPFVARQGGSFVCFFVDPTPTVTSWFGVSRTPEEMAMKYLVAHVDVVLRHIASGRELRRQRP